MTARKPLVADSRTAEERRRLRRHLFRPGGAGGQGCELGADRSGAEVRTDVPPLRADQGTVRKGLGAAGCRASLVRDDRTTVNQSRRLVSAILTVSVQLFRQSSVSNAVPVTVDNFIRAESDLYFAASPEGQLASESSCTVASWRRSITRPSSDTTATRSIRAAVFDLDAGPVTITLPDAGKRFMSMQVINEDHYVPEVVYGKGSYTLTKDKVGTRYVPSRSGRWSIPDTRGYRAGSRAAGRDQGRARRPPANSRCRTGIRPARRRCATRCSCSPRRSPTPARRSAPRTRSTRSAI